MASFSSSSNAPSALQRNHLESAVSISGSPCWEARLREEAGALVRVCERKRRGNATTHLWYCTLQSGSNRNGGPAYSYAWLSVYCAGAKPKKAARGKDRGRACGREVSERNSHGERIDIGKSAQHKRRRTHATPIQTKIATRLLTTARHPARGRTRRGGWTLRCTWAAGRRCLQGSQRSGGVSSGITRNPGFRGVSTGVKGFPCRMIAHQARGKYRIFCRQSRCAQRGQVCEQMTLTNITPRVSVEF